MCSDEVETSELEEAQIGTDIVEIERFRGLTEDSPFVQRVFTRIESSYCFSFQDPAPHLAVTFAGKEAVAKALELNNIGRIASIEIIRSTEGVPNVRLLDGPDGNQIRVSLSFSSTHAVAVAVSYPRARSLELGDIQAKIDRAVLELLQRE
ncbi:MAG: 4'-phosphopantetheinyl transferase superfamily protein [Candidatus Thorarchaeota archaeon]|nr:MAG: 4'-phosphopantetheinyl transferase superfamily protein [Candidatus Thorarchaeota archaeon]